MGKIKVPNTYVIIFAALFICCIGTWLVPGGNPQTWQLFSAMFEGFSRQAEIIAFVLIIGGAYQGKLDFAKDAFGITGEDEDHSQLRTFRQSGHLSISDPQPFRYGKVLVRRKVADCRGPGIRSRKR